MRSYECSSWKYVNWVWCIEVQLETCRLQIVHCAVPMGTFFWQTLLIPLSGSLSQPSKQVLLRWIRRRWACNMFHTSVTWWHPCFSQDTWDGLATVCTIFGRVRIQIWYLDVERNVDTYFMQFVSKPYAQSFWIILVLVSISNLVTSWKPVKVGRKPWRSDIWPAWFAPALVPWQLNKSFKRESYQNDYLATGNQKVSQQCYGVSVFFGWGAGVWTRSSNQGSFSHNWKTAKLWNHPGYQGSILRKSNMFVQKICTTYHPPQLMSHQGIFPSWDSWLWILIFYLGWLVDPACSVLSLFILRF